MTYYQINVGTAVPQARPVLAKDGSRWVEHYGDSEKISDKGASLDRKPLRLLVNESNPELVVLATTTVDMALEQSARQQFRWREQAGVDTRLRGLNAPRGNVLYHYKDAVEAMGWGRRHGGPSNSDAGIIVRVWAALPDMKRQILESIRLGDSVKDVAEAISDLDPIWDVKA